MHNKQRVGKRPAQQSKRSDPADEAPVSIDRVKVDSLDLEVKVERMVRGAQRVMRCLRPLFEDLEKLALRVLALVLLVKHMLG